MHRSQARLPPPYSPIGEIAPAVIRFGSAATRPPIIARLPRMSESGGFRSSYDVNCSDGPEYADGSHLAPAVAAIRLRSEKHLRRRDRRYGHPALRPRAALLLSG